MAPCPFFFALIKPMGPQACAAKAVPLLRDQEFSSA
jgi:hypothetical protein